MPVPNTFGTATSAIPLSQLDANFATPITIGNTAVQLGNTVTTLNNMTLANVTISSGTITITNVAVTTANVSGTANISTLVVVGNETVGGNTTITGNITAANANVTSNLVLSGGTANGVAYLNTSKQVTTGSVLQFDGTGTVTINGGSGANGILRLIRTGGFPGDFSILAGGQSATTNFLLYDNTNSQNAYLYLGGASGYHAWYQSGTERMRLDSSGNLGLGVTPGDWNANNKVFQLSNNASLFSRSGLTGVAQNFRYNASDTGIFMSAGYATLYYQNAGAHVWTVSTTSWNGMGSDTASMSQAMTLDVSGNLLVGDTSATANSRFRVVSSSTSNSDFAVYITNSSGTNLLSITGGGVFSTGSAGSSPYNNTTASSANVIIDSNGTLGRSTSSLKYKTNVQDATHGLADLLQLRSVTYEGKAETDAGKTFGGLIAEEVHEAGLTEFVQYAKDGTPDALAYGNMVSLCIKAIQEQQALITQLTARITALEGA
jgi:hypothetical protein